MLYIFHVDTGRMMTFDMNLALESVQFLKETIERHHNLAATSQVLLVSGGEMLQPNARVCSYSAGTDTNPIYMFSTNIIESQNPPKPWPSIEADTDLKDKIEQCLELPANYNTVVIRAQLAQQCYELAKEETKICEKLVHEQHLQQQGWAAVVANMEDNTEEFKTRCDNFYRSFDAHLERRDQYLEFVAHFNDDLDNLSKIPILPSLMRCAEEIPFHAFDDYLNDSESFTKPTNPDDPHGLSIRGMSRQNSREPTPELRGNIELGDKKIRTLSLLQWISASENQKSLKHLAGNCAKGLQLFDEKAMGSLKFEAQKAIDAAQQDNMKEIKGLEDRLCGLEKLMYDARKYVQEQCELAQAFQQNQMRANNLGDASILPDLCASHCSQLLVMSKNHKHLRDIRRRITKAKEELATNLNRRLKYVIYIENRMYDIDNSLLFYHRCLRRLQRHLGIIEQIHKAPCMYVSAVTEVVRRRVFSSAFLMWASNLACQLLTIYNEEVMRRHDFSSLFEGHFLSTLFPGMKDMPPTYATEAPLIFDASLPQLTKDDISLLSNHLPEITSKIQLPDLGAVIDFFSSRSGILKRSDIDKSPVESSRLSDGGAEPPNLKPIEIHAHLKDFERGFESETDTEEFEKVGQSPIERNREGVTTISGHTQTSLQATTTTLSTSQQPFIKPETCNTSTSMETITTQSTETLTEDNLGSTRLEVEKYRNLLRIMLKLSSDSLTHLKQQLKDYRDTTESEKVQFKAQLTELSKKWNLIMLETEENQRSLIEKIHAENEQKLCDFNKTLLDKTNELHILKNEKLNVEEEYMNRVIQLQNENENLKKTIGELDERIKLFEITFESIDTDKAKALTELKDKLIHEHKTEIESLRCRFKLMTYMERSPSDSSLEKIERPEMIEITNHESILLQTKEDLEQEKEMAIKVAVEKERARHENYPNSPQILISGSPRSPNTSSSDLYRRILEEKERQIDTMRERENILIKENQKFRETIQQLADCEPYGDQISLLKTQFDSLQRDKQKLAEELEMERSRRVEMERSVTAVRTESKIESTVKELATSPDPSRSRSRLTYPSKSNVTFTSCTEGDHVMVVWNTVHGQYTIVQDAPILYFLHGDSYAPLSLQQCAHGEVPKTIYCVGVVVVKEYCHARKDENRYKVSKGTKFYRVKVNPRKCDVTKAQQKREKLDSCGGIGGGGGGTSSSSESVSRSTSTEKCNQSFQFIDSFAQTELDPVLEDSVPNTTSKDMIDSGVAKSICKERNISITEDESDDRCRYVIMPDELSHENTNEEDYGNQLQLSATPTIILEDNELQPDFDDNENSNVNSDSNEKLHCLVEHPNDDDSDEYRSLESQ